MGAVLMAGSMTGAPPTSDGVMPAAVDLAGATTRGADLVIDDVVDDQSTLGQVSVGLGLDRLKKHGRASDR
jgi:hypothetical protein